MLESTCCSVYYNQLFIAGIVTQTPGMTIMAASLAAVLGGVWASVNSSLRRKIAQVEQR